LYGIYYQGTEETGSLRDLRPSVLRMECDDDDLPSNFLQYAKQRMLDWQFKIKELLASYLF